MLRPMLLLFGISAGEVEVADFCRPEPSTVLTLLVEVAVVLSSSCLKRATLPAELEEMAEITRDMVQ